MKEEKTQNIFPYFWLSTGTHHKFLQLGPKKSFKMWRIWAIFFSLKILCIG
jgi:hypothetical protein